MGVLQETASHYFPDLIIYHPAQLQAHWTAIAPTHQKCSGLMLTSAWNYFLQLDTHFTFPFPQLLDAYHLEEPSPGQCT